MAAGVMAHESALRDGEMLAVPDWGDAPEWHWASADMLRNRPPRSLGLIPQPGQVYDSGIVGGFVPWSGSGKADGAVVSPVSAEVVITISRALRYRV
jgi:hypothetical protein